MFEEQEKIDKYLADQMTKQERKLFETEMNSNPELADTVQLNRDMEGFFDDYTPDLEEQLTDLGKQYFQATDGPSTKVSRKQINKWWIILPVLLVGVLGWWIISSSSDTESTPSDPVLEAPTNNPTEKTDTENTIPDEENTVLDEENTIPEDAEEVEPTDLKDNIPPTDNQLPDIDPNTPIASIDPADFVPNPAFEEIIREYVRDNNNTEISTPAQNTNYELSELIAIKVIGKTKARPPFNLSIYSNSPEDFDNDIKIIDKTLISRSTDTGYSFRFNAQIPLKGGLYYWIIQDKDGELLYSDRFTVGKENSGR